MGRWQPDARTRLQEAALALYGERGYDETTVAQIAERAGLTKRTFFRYFADKREVLFWGSHLLQELMVAAIAAAPESASTSESAPPSPLDLIGAALDAAGLQFEQVRDHAALRHRIVASSPELQERELIKGASLAAAMAQALRARGVGDTAATLAAHTGATVLHVAYGQWAQDPQHRPFQQIARDVLAQFREVAAAG